MPTVPAVVPIPACVAEPTAEGVLVALIAELEARADARAAEGSPLATTYARLAAEVEATVRTWLATPVTLVAGARTSGYSEQQLRRLRDAGVLTLTRGDLPRRPGTQPARTIVRRLDTRGRGLRAG